MEVKAVEETKQAAPLNIVAAATFTGYSPKYLYRLVHERRIPFYKPQGGRVLFKREELEAFIYRNRSTPDYELKEKAEAMIAGGRV
jgi:excisionase family DNA binding protein